MTKQPKTLSIKLIGLIAISVFLSGCYVTDYEVLGAGDRIPLSGKYVCRANWQIIRLDLNEVSHGFFSRSYEYFDATEKSTNRFKHIRDNFYLVQSRPSAENRVQFGFQYMFAYYQFNAPGKLTMYTANINPQPALHAQNELSAVLTAIHATAQRNAIRIIKLQAGARLEGTPANTETFLLQHTPEMLRKIGECIHE